MKLTDFDRCVCVTHDTRRAAFERTRRLLESRGVEARAFVNGDPPGPGLDQVNDVPKPSTFGPAVGAWNLYRGFLEVVRRARADGVASLLLVEDDLELTPDFDAVTAAVEPPGDWQLFYLGASHGWSTTTPIGPHLMRIRGSYMTHCVAVRADAFDLVLALPPEGDIDFLLARHIQPLGRSYAVWPSVARQAPGPSMTSGKFEDYGHLFESRGANW